MTKKQKLELTWIGKGERPRLEPRILIEDPELSYHAKTRVSENDIFDNRLIMGDNLLALKALEQEFAGKVKCIFIDPPYNTGSAFEHYDDGLEHSQWLSLMQPRLELLHRLLADDGSIWVTIDDNEAHYLKVLMDEIWGRNNFIGNSIWEKSDSPRMDAVFFSSRHDNIFCFAKNIDTVLFKKIPTEEIPEHYNRTDENGRKYYTKPLRAMGGQGETRAARPTLYYALTAPDGTSVYPKLQDGTDGAWRWSSEKVVVDKDKIEWVNGRNGWTPYYRIYADNIKDRPAETIWPHSEVGTNRTSKAEIKALNLSERAFDTPKPEGLIRRILEISTNKNDLVLDSFLGSGTTAAVAHKMGRRWIGIEMGEHAKTHCAPRLQKVVDGEQGGISEAVSWKGGGGFRFYRLAPSLLEKDRWDNWVIAQTYNPTMLAEAVCKLMGFAYAPSDRHYWLHGKSSETDFIYVTTQCLTHEQLRAISEEVGDDRSLLVCCKAFSSTNLEAFANLTVKKIPQTVLRRCEWGRDDYSLNVANLPPPPEEAEEAPVAKPTKGKGKAKAAEPSLFDGKED